TPWSALRSSQGARRAVTEEPLAKSAVARSTAVGSPIRVRILAHPPCPIPLRVHWYPDPRHRAHRPPHHPLPDARRPDAGGRVPNVDLRLIPGRRPATEPGRCVLSR